MKKTLATAAAVALLLPLGFAACGSDDSGDSPDEALTKAELITQADQLCTDTNSSLVEKADEQLDEASTEVEGMTFVSDEAVPLYETLGEKLRALTPGPSEADAYTELLDTYDAELQKVADDPSLLFSNDTAFPDAGKLAQAFGFKVCGSPPSE